MRREVYAALVEASEVFGWLDTFQEMAKGGHASEATAALQMALRLAGDCKLSIGAVVAQAQPADAFDRTQSTIAAVLRRQAEPHLNAANDEHSPAPSEPAPSIA